MAISNLGSSLPVMPYELLWLPDADAVMTKLESDPSRAAALAAIRRTLGRLELDPFNPRWGTRQFQPPTYGHIRVTPSGFDAWYVLWKPGSDESNVEIVHLVELPL